MKANRGLPKIFYSMIRRKNIMHKSHYILGNEIMKQKYKKNLNKLTKIKSNTKKQYYVQELEAIRERRGIYSQVIQRNLLLNLLLLMRT